MRIVGRIITREYEIIAERTIAMIPSGHRMFVRNAIPLDVIIVMYTDALDNARPFNLMYIRTSTRAARERERERDMCRQLSRPTCSPK